MKPLDQFPQIYLCKNSVDFRKSIDGLGALVQEELKLDLFEPALFVFCCSKRKRIKILYWDKTGFALWYKRLEKDRFPWPSNNQSEIVTIKSKELRWLLDGIDLWKIKPHIDRSYQKIC
jgi:transposase